jgi:uncharacterized protein YicC (UPF0701 family)
VAAAWNQDTVVEELRQLIEHLVRERQELRGTGTVGRRLEANRLELIRAQWALATALIERHRIDEAA